VLNVVLLLFVPMLWGYEVRHHRDAAVRGRAHARQRRSRRAPPGAHIGAGEQRR
jgi:hypothetical protein